MLMFEFVITKSPENWTDNEWLEVREVLKNNELTLDAFKKLFLT